MIVGRSMHERWLSNAYVVGDAPGGTAVFVDSGASLGPLLELVERESLTPTHLLRTHTHPDHIEHEDELCARFGIPVVTGDLVTGGLTARALALPGHSDDGVELHLDESMHREGVRAEATGGGLFLARRDVDDRCGRQRAADEEDGERNPLMFARKTTNWTSDVKFHWRNQPVGGMGRRRKSYRTPERCPIPDTRELSYTQS